MHVWISLAAAPVPVLSTADQVTGFTFTWLAQLPVIDNAPVFAHCCPCSTYVAVKIKKAVSK